MGSTMRSSENWQSTQLCNGGLFSIAPGLADTGRFRNFATLEGVRLLAMPERVIDWSDLVARSDAVDCLAVR